MTPEDAALPSAEDGRPPSVRRYVPLVASTLAIALLLVTGLAGRVTLGRMVESSAAVDETYAVLLRVDAVSLNLASVISAARGFMLTGLGEFLRPVDGLRRQLDEDLLVLGELLAQKPAQLERLAECRQLIERRLAWRSTPVTPCRTAAPCESRRPTPSWMPHSCRLILE